MQKSFFCFCFFPSCSVLFFPSLLALKKKVKKSPSFYVREERSETQVFYSKREEIFSIFMCIFVARRA